MGAGKIIAIIGGIVGILSIALYHVLPEFFCLWRLEAGAALKVWIGGFGFTAGETGGVGVDPEYAEEILLLIIAILIVAGGALAIIGGLTESKLFGILGGVAMLAGSIGFIVGALIEYGTFEDLALAIGLFGGEGLLFGSAGGADWGIWIGLYMAIAGGVLGLIGGATT
jgi:hypothetical protein